MTALPLPGMGSVDVPAIPTGNAAVSPLSPPTVESVSTFRIELHVLENPRPMGEVKAFNIGGVARVVHSKPKELRAWQGAVTAEAIDAMAGRPPLDRAVQVTVTFFLVRPMGHTGKRGLLPSAPRWPTSRPDLDHYIRSTLDALTLAGVFRDDSRVVRIVAAKAFCSEARPRPGAAIVVEEML